MTNLADANTVLVFGGSFDPPTVAHVRLPPLAARAVGADLVAYIPAAVSPFKVGQTDTSFEQRFAMLQSALQGIEHVIILTDEYDRAAAGEPSYTVDTLATLRARLPEDVTLRLLIGSDQSRAFDRWREHEKILELAEPVVMVRPPETRDGVLDALPAGFDRDTWANRLVDVPAIDVSSTEVRRRVAAGEPVHGLTPPAVATYIAEHGLYRENGS